MDHDERGYSCPQYGVDMIIGRDIRRFYGIGAVQVRALDGVSLRSGKVNL